MQNPGRFTELLVLVVGVDDYLFDQRVDLVAHYYSVAARRSVARAELRARMPAQLPEVHDANLSKDTGPGGDRPHGVR